ncbi:MAG: hypothetical protein ACKVZJ_14250 [Phycisphaerales bacterium]
MTWTTPQRKLVLVAANKAGWNDQQRYLAMRACGCPLKAGKPSVTHEGNGRDHLVAVMALAESCAAQRGVTDFPRPGRSEVGSTARRPHVTWRDAALDAGQYLRDKARKIWAEAKERAPGLLRADASLEAFALRQCARDHEPEGGAPELYAFPVESFDELDTGQLIRVIEGLRAWLGRAFFRSGLTPRTFTIPRHAIDQAQSEARRHVAIRQASTPTPAGVATEDIPW